MDSGDGRKSLSPKCDLCSDHAVAMIRAPRGCACLTNVYQRRCHQHLLRAQDTCDEFQIVEDYALEQEFLPPKEGTGTEIISIPGNHRNSG